MDTASKQSTWYQRKAVWVLAIILSALAVFATTTQTWINAQPATGAIQLGEIAVPGNKAAPAVTALAVVVLAGGLASSIASNVARIIAAGLSLVAALAMVASVIAVIVNPAVAAQGQVAEQIGLSGTELVTTMTVFPWLALAGSILAVLVIIGFLSYQGSFAQNGRSRYQREDSGSDKAVESETTVDDDISRWDTLSRGEDPTT